MPHRYFANKCVAVETNAKVMKDTHYSHHAGTGYILKQPQNIRKIPSIKKTKG